MIIGVLILAIIAVLVTIAIIVNAEWHHVEPLPRMTLTRRQMRRLRRNRADLRIALRRNRRIQPFIARNPQ